MTICSRIKGWARRFFCPAYTIIQPVFIDDVFYQVLGWDLAGQQRINTNVRTWSSPNYAMVPANWTARLRCFFQPPLPNPNPDLSNVRYGGTPARKLTKAELRKVYDHPSMRKNDSV